MNSGGLGDYSYKKDVAGNNYTYSYLKLRSDANAAKWKKAAGFLNKYGGATNKANGYEQTIAPTALLDIHTPDGFELEIIKPVSTISFIS